MFKRLFEKQIAEEVERRLQKARLLEIVSLDRDKSYLLGVESEEIAKALSEALESNLDLSKGPRILVMVSKLRVVEV